VLGAFNYLGTYAPWSPKMEAWTSATTPVNYLERRSPLERQGALVFHNKQCINCHNVGGEGGLRGPALDSVATRLTGDQLARQVIQGSGNMPAYGKNLNPSEVAALVAFMSTLHKPTETPARDSTRPSQAANEVEQPNPTTEMAKAKR
jgi:ubiquinol-cytochrome c reductase cytochrome b subunit